MAKTARQRVFDGIKTLPDGLVPFVEKRLENMTQTHWLGETGEATAYNAPVAHWAGLGRLAAGVSGQDANRPRGFDI